MEKWDVWQYVIDKTTALFWNNTTTKPSDWLTCYSVCGTPLCQSHPLNYGFSPFFGITIGNWDLFGFLCPFLLHKDTLIWKCEKLCIIVLLKAFGNEKYSSCGSSVSYCNIFKINLSLNYENLAPMKEEESYYWCTLYPYFIHKVISFLKVELI